MGFLVLFVAVAQQKVGLPDARVAYYDHFDEVIVGELGALAGTHS